MDENEFNAKMEKYRKKYESRDSDKNLNKKIKLN